MGRRAADLGPVLRSTFTGNSIPRLVLEIWTPVHPIPNIRFMRLAGVSLSLFFMKSLFNPGHLETILSVAPSLDWSFTCPFFHRGSISLGPQPSWDSHLQNPLLLSQPPSTGSSLWVLNSPLGSVTSTHQLSALSLHPWFVSASQGFLWLSQAWSGINKNSADNNGYLMTFQL